MTDRVDVDVGYREPLDPRDQPADDDRTTQAEVEQDASCPEAKLDAGAAAMLDEAIAWAVRRGG